MKEAAKLRSSKAEVTRLFGKLGVGPRRGVGDGRPLPHCMWGYLMGLINEFMPTLCMINY